MAYSSYTVLCFDVFIDHILTYASQTSRFYLNGQIKQATLLHIGMYSKDRLVSNSESDTSIVMVLVVKAICFPSFSISC